MSAEFRGYVSPQLSPPKQRTPLPPDIESLRVMLRRLVYHTGNGSGSSQKEKDKDYKIYLAATALLMLLGGCAEVAVNGESSIVLGLISGSGGGW